MIRLSVCLLALLPIAGSAQTAAVPLIVEGNVPMIDLEFVRSDGSVQTGRFILDSGGGAFLLTEKLANAIGLKPTGPARSSEGARFAPLAPPEVRVGGMPLDLKGARVLMIAGADRFDFRDGADGLFPGHVLERYHVIFDYPERKFTLAAPGSVKPSGVAVPSPVRPNNGFARIELAIGGKNFGFLLDTGARYTMISQATLEEWSGAASAPWPRHIGAMGAANMGGGKMESDALMTRIPEMRLGDFAIIGAGAVSRPVGTFEKSMSNMMTAPIVGALGGNVLWQFRVEIDYAAGVTYFERSGKDDADDLNMVGLMLTEAPNHSVAVTAISAAADKTAREQIRPGDLLRSVDGASVAGLSLLQIVDRLRESRATRRSWT